MAIRASSACRWSTSSSTDLSDWTIKGPSVTPLYTFRGADPPTSVPLVEGCGALTGGGIVTTPTPEEPPREDNPFHAPDFATSRPEVPQNTAGGFATGAYPGMSPLPPAPPVQRVGTVTKVLIGVGLVLALGLGSLSAFGF